MRSVNFWYGGFTLIELMVVMLIISVLSGGSIAAFLSFNQSQQLTSDARSVYTEINRARSLAATQQYPTGCTSLHGVNLRSTLIDGSLTGVILTSQCDPVDIVSPEVKILNNTVFQTPFEINFLVGSGYVVDGEDIDIIVRSPDDASVYKVIHIGAYGSTNIYEP